MAIKMEITDKSNKILVSANEIIGYEYVYENQNSIYAKSTKESNVLKITGDISRFLERSPVELDNVRKWPSQKYVKADDYKNVLIKYVVEDGNPNISTDKSEKELNVSRHVRFIKIHIFTK